MTEYNRVTVYTAEQQNNTTSAKLFGAGNGENKRTTARVSDSGGREIMTILIMCSCDYKGRKSVSVAVPHRRQLEMRSRKSSRRVRRRISRETPRDAE